MMIYPLSNAQNEIWYDQLRYKDSSLFNIGGTVHIKGNINVSTLRRSILSVIMKNTALRLQFVEKNNQVCQYVSNKECMVDDMDFSLRKDPWQEFHKWCNTQIQSPFPMLNSPLYYFAIFKITDDDMGYFIKLHHIIADGWSIKLLTDQVTEHYEKAVLGNPCNISPPSYIDYVLKEKKDTVQNKAGMFWKDMLTPLPDITFASNPNMQGKRRIFIPNKEIQLSVEQYIEKKNISLNTLFVFAYLLYEYKRSGNKDIILGTPLLGRKSKAERQIFGTFANTMPFRYNIDENALLKDMLKRVSWELKNSFRYQNYSCHLLYKELKLSEHGIDSLYHVCINYYNTVLKSSIDGMKIKNTEFYNGQQKYALQIIIRHWNDIKFQLEFDYQTSVYSQKQVEELYHQILLLIDQIIKNDEMKVKDLSLTTKEERVKFLDEYNKTEESCPTDKTWLDIFDEVAHSRPGSIAISKDQEQLTYEELREQSNRYTGYFISKGVKKGDIIAIVPQHNIQSIVIIIAIMRSGGIYLPIDLNTPKGRINDILSSSGAKYFIAEENCDGFCGTFLSIRQEPSQNERARKVTRSTPKGISYLIYTSGSTGVPKGVLITHKSLMNYLWWARGKYLTNEKEVFALYSSFAFDFTMTSMLLPLIVGGQIRIYDPEKNKNVFRKIITDNQATIVKITPSHIVLINDIKHENSSIHTFIVGGENLRRDACDKLYNQFNKQVKIYNEYGPTEATVGCMTYLYQEDAYDSVPVGRPIANTRIYLLDHDGHPVPYHMLGEIYIGGDGVSKGYHNLSEETAKRFIKSPFVQKDMLYKTGDMAYRNEADDIIFYGRVDSEVKIRGNRIDLYEIRQRLLTSHLVQDAVVQVVHRKNKSKQLCAYIIPAMQYDEETVKQYLKHYLPDYMIPEFYVLLQQFPLTINGKIDYHELPAIDEEQKRSNEKEFVREFELLHDVIKEVMDEDISMEDNFYTIGGDSIKAIQISTRLSDKGYELSVKDILKNPNISKMTACIKAGNNILDQQELLSGEIMLHPILSWFFDQEFKEMGHYNQSVLLELKQNMELELLNNVFKELIRHHDMLRANYNEKDEVLYYNNEHLNDYEIVDTLTIADSDPRDLTTIIEEEINHCFDLQQDLLLRAYLIPISGKHYFYISAHHFVIDGVSWRILLEDMESLLLSYVTKQRISLQKKTSSYQHFTKEYHENRRNFRLPSECDNKEVAYGEQITEKFKLDTEATEKLIGKANEAYHTKIQELLIIAFVQSMNMLFGANEIQIKVEHHGRDMLESVNVNRTVGWFTTIDSIDLKLQSDEFQEQIMSLKDQIRKKNKENVKPMMEEKSIRFNYLGEYIESQNGCFSICKVLFDHDISEKNKATAFIDVNAIILKKELHVSIRYGKDMEKTVRSMAQAYKDQLTRLIEYLTDRKEQNYTPSDFDMAGLSKEELYELFHAQEMR